jgi:hypothetical protein
MLPSQNCPATRQERFIAGQEPTQPDMTHIAVPIDPALGCRAPAGYPANRVTTRTFRILPPEAESWVEAAGLARVPRNLCPTIVTSTLEDKETRRQGDNLNANLLVSPSPGLTVSPAPALLAPAPGAVFAISPGVPRERQQIELKARAGLEATKLTFVIDGQPLATLDRPPYRTFWPLAPGSHRARVDTTDTNGKVTHSATVEFVVEEP